MLGVGRRTAGAPRSVEALLPRLDQRFELRVVPGPHGAPEHLTTAGVAALLDADWHVHANSDRTGVTLNGPRPAFARTDGGDAGLHPSNLHDGAYPVGGIMLAGDSPVVVGPDGPSLGGFVVPATVIAADQWKLAQLRPGDAVRLMAVGPAEADAVRRERAGAIARLAVGDSPLAGAGAQPPAAPWRSTAPLLQLAADGGRPSLSVRWAGERHLLAELGPPTLDLGLRMQVHEVARQLQGRAADGITEVVEGVRSVLVRVDEPADVRALAEEIARIVAHLPESEDIAVPVREVTLPLAFDDALAHEAMRRYETVRPDAPWGPDNVEFIRRVNGLDRREAVAETVFAARYLVVGLGDVYLGAPVAVPLDPRHRLVTTKYNPPRPWTPANAVGIGGQYLCIYGMEGPGGYQLVGRTVPVWRIDPQGEQEPWLLRHFDVLRFRPVSTEQLEGHRARILAGQEELVTRPITLDLGRQRRRELADAEEIATITRHRRRAFAEELARWG